MIKTAPAALLALCSLSACATPGSYAPQDRMPVSFGEAVPVGAWRASPLAVVEDSRCPVNVECLWAGRLVVSTRIDGPDWSETVPLVLGEPYLARGTTITLTAAHPDKVSERQIPPREYRFLYDGGS
jgi:hypothetical protein